MHIIPISNLIESYTKYIHLRCILHALILINNFHTSHKHPTITKILNTTQWESHTMETPPITKIAFTLYTTHMH